MPYTLMEQISNGRVKEAIALIDAGADITGSKSRSWYVDTPLSVAVRKGYVAVVKAILARSEAVQAIDRLDTCLQSPLEIAIINNHLSIVKLLLSCEGIFTSPGRWEKFYQIACRNGNVEIVELLLANPEARCACGETNSLGIALLLAVLHNHLPVVKLLLSSEQSLDVTKAYTSRHTALSIAVSKSNLPMIKIIKAALYADMLATQNTSFLYKEKWMEFNEEECGLIAKRICSYYKSPTQKAPANFLSYIVDNILINTTLQEIIIKEIQEYKINYYAKCFIEGIKPAFLGWDIDTQIAYLNIEEQTKIQEEIIKNIRKNGLPPGFSPAIEHTGSFARQLEILDPLRKLLINEEIKNFLTSAYNDLEEDVAQALYILDRKTFPSPYIFLQSEASSLAKIRDELEQRQDTPGVAEEELKEITKNIKSLAKRIAEVTVKLVTYHKEITLFGGLCPYFLQKFKSDSLIELAPDEAICIKRVIGKVKLYENFYPFCLRQELAAIEIKLGKAMTLIGEGELVVSEGCGDGVAGDTITEEEDTTHVIMGESVATNDHNN